MDQYKTFSASGEVNKRFCLPEILGTWAGTPFRGRFVLGEFVVYYTIRCQIIRILDEVASHDQCDQKKSPNLYKCCSKMISLEKLQILAPLQNLPKNVGRLGQINC